MCTAHMLPSGHLMSSNHSKVIFNLPRWLRLLKESVTGGGGEGGVKMIHYLANPFSSSRCLFEPFVTKMCRLCLLYLQSWSKLQNFQAKTDFSRFQQNIFVSCWIKFVLFFVGFHLFVKDLIDWLSPNFWSPSFRMNLIIKRTDRS